jgi:hypothetical protein
MNAKLELCFHRVNLHYKNICFTSFRRVKNPLRSVTVTMEDNEPQRDTRWRLIVVAMKEKENVFYSLLGGEN